MQPRPIRVLVAEDNAVLSDVLQFNLIHAGFDVRVAADGQEAVALLESSPVDLLITDFQMPLMNGEALCRYVREQPHLRYLPIIVCSAKGMEMDKERLSDELQVARLVYKPFSMRDIVASVRELTAGAAAHGTA